MAPAPQKAGLFHTGNTCPFCQETVDEGQVIVICPNCGSIQHESCWNRKGKCSSYHCDDAVRSDVATVQADIRISAEELTRVQVPPKPVRQAPDAVARQYAPPAPQRISRLALAGTGIGLFSLAGIVGAFTGSSPLILLGIAASLGATVLCVIALVFINSNRKLSGLGMASLTVLVSVALLLVDLGVLGHKHSRERSNFQSDLKIAENLPKEEYLARLAPPIARALRANVIVRYSAGTLGEHSYGSGIIVRVVENRAHILTNKHVIGDGRAGKITVTLFTGESSPAEVVWSAPEGVDMAILSCQALTLRNFEPVPIAQELATHGQKVFAVGNPMELSWSYAEGTISGLRTSNMGSTPLDVYQTQTPLNPGNSGGGLYTTDGRLVGLNTWTHDKATGEGLGFATATTSILRLLREGKVSDLVAPAKAEEEPTP